MVTFSTAQERNLPGTRCGFSLTQAADDGAPKSSLRPRAWAVEWQSPQRVSSAPGQPRPRWGAVRRRRLVAPKGCPALAARTPGSEVWGANTHLRCRRQRATRGSHRGTRRQGGQRRPPALCLPSVRRSGSARAPRVLPADRPRHGAETAAPGRDPHSPGPVLPPLRRWGPRATH